MGSHGHQLGEDIGAGDSGVRGVDRESFHQRGTCGPKTNTCWSQISTGTLLGSQNPSSCSAPSPQKLPGEQGIAKPHCLGFPERAPRRQQPSASPFTDCRVSKAGTASW